MDSMHDGSTVDGVPKTFEGANTSAVSAGESIANQAAMLPSQALASILSAGASAENANTSAVSAGVQGFLQYLQTASNIAGSGVSPRTGLSTYQQYESQFTPNAQGMMYGGT